MNARDTELLALRIATGLVPTDEVEAAVDTLLAEGYCFWVCPYGPQLHRVLRGVPTSHCHVHGSELIEVRGPAMILECTLCRVDEVSMCATWEVERDGVRLNLLHYDRDAALRAAWSHAAATGRVVGKQTLAVMLRPPKGYAIVLVAGSSCLPHRFTHEVNPP